MIGYPEDMKIFLRDILISRKEIGHLSQAYRDSTLNEMMQSEVETL